MTAEVEAQLCRMSPATIDRLLHPWRRLGGRRPFTTTKLGSSLKRPIPIRTFADWQEDRPGFVEVDLVHHCGEITEGFYLTTLSTMDVASGWSECIGVWGKGQQRVGAAVHLMRPFPLLGLDSDNGGELAEVSADLSAHQPAPLYLIAAGRASPLPALAPTRRTIAVMWSKRTGRWCGGW